LKLFIISASKFDECNRLLPDGTPDSTRRKGVCAHARVAQQCLQEDCSQMIGMESPNNSPYLNTVEISCLGNDTWSYFETFNQSQKQFL